MGIPLAGIGLVGLGLAQGVIALSVINGAIIGLGMSAGFLLPVQTATANWFNRRRSTALAVVSAASVAGAAIAIFLEQFIAGQFPWRGIFQVLGLVMLVIGIPLALMMRHRPEPHGYLPDGERTTTGKLEGLADQSIPGTVEVNFTLREALKAKPFWILAAAMGLANWLTMAHFFRFSLLLDRGMSSEVASLSSTITPLVGVVGILVFGFLGDRYSKRHLLALAVVIQAVSMFMSLVGGTVFQIILYPLIFGLGYGTVPLILAIRADYFGRRYFATITVAATLVAGIMGSPVAFLSSASSGWLYDMTDSFIPTLLLSLLVGLATATLFLYARPPAPPREATASPRASDRT
jgi:MFS family permease